MTAHQAIVNFEFETKDPRAAYTICTSKKFPARISNQYLLRQLAIIARLGRTNVSTQLLVEAWQLQALQADDLFFMHFDVLAEYGFLKVTAEAATLPIQNSVAELSKPGQFEQQVSITQAGEDFLERYY